MEDKFFLCQIKHTNGNYEKGIAVKNTEDAAKQSFHAYLGAYGYGNDPNTDYVQVAILSIAGAVIASCVDDRRTEPEPEE